MKNNRYINNRALAFILSMMVIGMTVISCGEEAEVDAPVIGDPSSISVLSFGPSNIVAGEVLTFIGTNLDKVTGIVLPGDMAITSFDTHTSTKIAFVLPEDVPDGLVTVQTTEGDFTTTTELGIGRPIEVTSFSPATVRPGESVTLTGDFLNLVQSVTFSSGKVVLAADFTSASKTSLELVVPVDAQTGLVTVSYTPEQTWKDEQVVESDVELGVVLPAVTAINPTPIKPGETLTLTGTNLDLATKILFASGDIIESADFGSVSATTIEVTAPATAQDGILTLTAASFVEVETSAITIVVPTITNTAPTTLALNEDVTITGTDLDLVTSINFSDGSSVGSGDFVSQSATEIVVTVTSTATDGAMTLNLASGNSLSTDALSIVLPTILSTGGVLSLSVNTLGGPAVVTITGTGLEDIASAAFVGEEGSTQWPADVTINSDTELTIEVTQGSISGPITLWSTNGDVIVSTESLTIVPDLPIITGMPTETIVGGVLSITGTNLDVLADVWMPGGNQAVTFASKSATLLEVVIPTTVPEGTGVVTFVNYANEILRTDELFFKLPGVEPVLETDLIINDFDEPSDHNLTWDNWKGAFAEATTGAGPGISNNGIYANGQDVTVSSWDWVQACNHDGLVKPSAVVAADYVFKIDVFVSVADADAVFGYRISEGNGGGDIDLGNVAAAVTPAWTTLTYDISGLPAVINPDGNQTANWGLTITGGDYNFAGFKWDNARFSLK